MKIRIINATGKGHDTRVELILGNTAIDISECFEDCIIKIPAGGEVEASLFVDRARIDIICEQYAIDVANLSNKGPL